ncbi:MAG: 4-hydroxybutyrate dehydrogenase [Lachnospiraceae bacterium]|nr:4-hydroxybutyrate dehydrogenase [Lachnospiraceae bacterium]
MKQLSIFPVIHKYNTISEFIDEFSICETDLILTSERSYNTFLSNKNITAHVIFREKYGKGEPTDVMAEAIGADIPADVKRIIAIGGGTILDLAKLYVLEQYSPIDELYDGNIPVKKARELILVPTTCGTGSEVTNISILALTKKGTKKGLANDALYPDAAILIPELLKGMPESVFATSSIDALIHAVESYLSPKATSFTEIFSKYAIELILKGYKKLKENGLEYREEIYEDFLVASTYAGIAFSNAGCAAVHALSYPLGAKYHVAHGESNYVMFTAVMKTYMGIKPDGKIASLNAFISNVLECISDEVYEDLEILLSTIIERKPMSSYGVTEAEIEEFTDSVIENQQRLLGNNYVFLDRNQIMGVYKKVF